MHIRQKVAEAFEAILEEIRPNQLPKSMKPIEASKDGLFSVYINEEQITKRADDVNTPIYYQRSLVLEIEIAVANAEQTNRFLVHELSQLVEEAVAEAGVDLDGLVDDVQLLGFTLEHTNDSTQTQVGVLSYQVDYVTLATDVETDTF